jgi:hypothetical protein
MNLNMYMFIYVYIYGDMILNKDNIVKPHRNGSAFNWIVESATKGVPPPSPPPFPQVLQSANTAIPCLIYLVR